MSKSLWSDERIGNYVEDFNERKLKPRTLAMGAMFTVRDEYEQHIAKSNAILANTQAQRDAAYRERAAMRDEAQRLLDDNMRLRNQMQVVILERDLLADMHPATANWLRQPQEQAAYDLTLVECFDLAMTGAME